MKNNISKNQVKVNTTEFEHSWGRAPRGNGSWAFHFGSFESVFFVDGSFTVAKAEAVRRAVETGNREVFVGS